MKCKYLLLVLLLFASFNLFGQQTEYPFVSVPQSLEKGIPAGWVLGGSNPHDYAVGVDLYESVSGFASAYLKSTSVKPVGFITLMQSFKANNYRSQKIKLTAYIKTQFVSGWSALWMRVNDQMGKPLSFDDMRNRPMVGTRDWAPVEIVLDIPPMSDEISFGILLNGKGQIWIDDIKISLADANTPVTDVSNDKTVNYTPRNLDFEE